MLYTKLGKTLSPTLDEFIYELDSYQILEKTITQIQSIKYISSPKYVSEKSLYDKSKGVLNSLTLISAPEDWLIREGYEQVGDLFGVKTRFIKKN